MLKQIYVIAGTLLILLGPFVGSLGQGLGTAVMFLGGCLLAGALILVVSPVLEKEVADRTYTYKSERAARYIAQQQEAIQKAAEEALKRRK